MLLLLLAYLGGALTLLSPCILPVLPFVFARADRPFLRSTLPLLLGMALTFTVVASLAAVGSQWVAQANQVGRWIALLLMALFALALLAATGRPPAGAVPARGCPPERARRCGGCRGARRRVDLAADRHRHWPAVGTVRRADPRPGADRRRPAWRQRRHHCLLLAYALGAITALALAVWIGGRVFRAMQARLGLGDVLRKVLGVAALLAVVAIGLGWDTGLLTRLSTVSTARIEQPAGCGARRAAGGTADDDDGRCQCRCRCTAAGGRHPARAGRCHRLAQQPAAEASSCAARWCWSISGPTPASTACARCRSCTNGSAATATTAWWWSACTRRSSPSSVTRAT
jgi:cytochrome c biogenesis protein CcdA